LGLFCNFRTNAKVFSGKVVIPTSKIKPEPKVARRKSALPLT